MSLGCLACRVDSPTHSLRSYSISSSDSDGRCATVISCWTRTSTMISSGNNSTMTSKVTPAPLGGSSRGVPGTPRLIRSHAVTRDLVRDWNFNEILLGR